MKTALNTIIAMMAGAVPAFAATGGRVDHSGLFVWIFLGFCALIVVAQVIPAVMMMVGMVKGVAASREAKEVKVTTH
jgi:hypothetical protein